MSDETSKLRLRPKLSPDSSAAPAQPPPATPAPTPASPADASPPSSAAAPSSATPVAATETPAVRFRPRVPPVPQPAAALPPSAPVAVAAAVVIPDPVTAAPSAPAAPQPSPVGPPSVVAPPAAGDAATAAPAELPTPQAVKRVRLVALGIGVAGMLVFGGVGYMAYHKVGDMLKEEATAESADEAEALPKKKTPIVEKQPATPTQAPVATQPARKAPPPPAAETRAATPATPAAVAPPVPSAPDTTATAAGNAQVQTWINKFKMSGVRGGSSPKILIDGKTFNVGDVVNPTLAVTFVGFDANRNVVRFKDAEGAIYERRAR